MSERLQCGHPDAPLLRRRLQAKPSDAGAAQLLSQHTCLSKHTYAHVAVPRAAAHTHFGARVSYSCLQQRGLVCAAAVFAQVARVRVEVIAAGVDAQ